MTKLSWDQSGINNYEGGLDRGVIYSPDGRVSAWSGLVSVTENFNNTSTPIYFDGQKISDFTTPGAFSGTIKAITYPDILNGLTGFDLLKPGIYVDSQRPKTFGLSYRTKVGDTDGYKIHIIYNVTAIPDDRNYESSNTNASIVDFSWQITSVPEEIDGYLPTSHFIIDSRAVTSLLLERIETILYGGVTPNPYLPSFAELITLISEWTSLEIIDNGDGTWTATTTLDGYITFLEDGKFRIDNADATFIDANTYTIQST
jgi:hypothetical protein